MKLIVLIVLVAGSFSAEFSNNFEELQKQERKMFSGRISFNANSYRRTPQPSTWECEYVKSVPARVRREMRLSPFYRKYLHAFGIPIISSSAPSDAALRRACYVVVFLMADRPDIRSWLYKRNGRAGVIGLREGVTSIPEHSWLGSSWNRRARGLGGTIRHPISTCGEENLMCSRGDRYPTEDIFLHEFVHGIHKVAIASRGAIQSFDGRLRARYDYLRRSGALWRGTYAMSSRDEYLAEGTQSFFDVNAQNNHVHNHVDTRPELLAYDRVLYNFVKEIWPCANRIVKRCDAARGNIPLVRYNFKMNCDRNGNGILMNFKTKRPVGVKPPTPPKPPTPAPPTPTKPQTPPQPPTPPKPQTPPQPPTPPKPQTPPQPPTPPKPQTPPPEPPRPPTPPPNTPAPPVNCRDRYSRCGYWARIGYCRRNPSFMKAYCKKSCNLCSGGGGNCRDYNHRCRYWAARRQCTFNPRYMRVYCKKSCRVC